MQALAARTSIAGTRIPQTSSASQSTARVAFEVEAKNLSRRQRIQKRHALIRKKISGTPERPRLAVYRSNEHMVAQLIDDTANDGTGVTVAHFSTHNKELKQSIAENLVKKKAGELEDEDTPYRCNSEAAAYKVGFGLGEVAKERGVEKVVFDRGGLEYVGRVQKVADGARAAGLVF